MVGIDRHYILTVEEVKGRIPHRNRGHKRANGWQHRKNQIIRLEAGRTVGERKYFSKTCIFRERRERSHGNKEDFLCRDWRFEPFAVHQSVGWMPMTFAMSWTNLQSRFGFL